MIEVSQVKTIISETGIKVQDVARLRRDLDWTRTWYDTRKALTDLPNRKAKVGQIEKAARKLSLLLAADDAWAAPYQVRWLRLTLTARTVVEAHCYSGSELQQADQGTCVGNEGLEEDERRTGHEYAQCFRLARRSSSRNGL